MTRLTSGSDGNAYGHISLINSDDKVRMVELYYKVEGSFFFFTCNAESKIVDVYNLGRVYTTNEDGSPATVRFEIN